jgi:hypothetical protein
MEGLRIKNRVRWVVLLPLLACGLPAGCVGIESFLTRADQPPTGEVRQVVATWNNEIVSVPDPYHLGAPTPGVAGRVYLFGEPADFPRAGEGTVTVDLYDVTASKGAPGPVPLERWQFDKMTLQRLLRRDPIGWGYTLFLPWSTYRPDVPSWDVVLRVCYQPAQGTPIYAESTLTLSRSGANQYQRTVRQDVPAAAMAAAAGQARAGGPTTPPPPTPPAPESPQRTAGSDGRPHSARFGM